MLENFSIIFEIHPKNSFLNRIEFCFEVKISDRFLIDLHKKKIGNFFLIDSD